MKHKAQNISAKCACQPGAVRLSACDAQAGRRGFAFGGKHRALKISEAVVAFFVVVYLIAALPSRAEAARLYFYPELQEIAEGESAIVELRLDTGGERINAADIRGEVTGDAIEMLNLETADSLFTIFPETPSVSDRKWSLSGGIPGGFAGDAVIGKLSITAGVVGDVKIHFAADSKVFLHGPESSVAALELASSVLTVATRGRDYLRITSASHPKQSDWSFEKSFYLTWQAEAGSDYSYKLSRLPNELPNGVADLPVGAVKFQNLDDGIYYFSLCKLINGQCGMVSRYRAMIDASPPEWKSIAFDQNDPEGNPRPTISFIAYDKNSGVDYYEVSTDGENFELAESPFFLPEKFSEAGLGGVVTLKAWDKAGNYTVTTAKLERISGTGTTGIIILASILLLLLLVMWISIQKRSVKNRL